MFPKIAWKVFLLHLLIDDSNSAGGNLRIFKCFYDFKFSLKWNDIHSNLSHLNSSSDHMQHFANCLSSVTQTLNEYLWCLDRQRR